jgi:hypothetical protein
LETVKEIGDIIKQVNTIEVEHNISERYQHPDETLLDSMVLSSASNVLVKCIESVDVNTSTYVSSEFADKIVNISKLLLSKSIVYIFRYHFVKMVNLKQKV